MPHRQQRTRTLAQSGELIAEVDPRRPSGRILRHAGMDASYVDLADAKHLEFDYMRWLRIVLRATGARRVLHVGGGACALPRALATEDPGGLQEVCEVDASVLSVARQHLGLRRMPGLRVRHAEGRAHIAAQPEGSWEAIVVDAFVGARFGRSANGSAIRSSLAARLPPCQILPPSPQTPPPILHRRASRGPNTSRRSPWRLHHSAMTPRSRTLPRRRDRPRILKSDGWRPDR